MRISHEHLQRRMPGNGADLVDLEPLFKEARRRLVPEVVPAEVCAARLFPDTPPAGVQLVVCPALEKSDSAFDLTLLQRSDRRLCSRA